ncbi:MAG: hypothetical protein BZY87_08120 [SAR202 cluster bacterium Io17-Chloro-G6]|nr:MAG: hypothetical protein BZY87_08120 [SAR202 cluster bacterium Io17-Chloro-G6]
MNDEQKTREQLLEELERERERSSALQEVSKKVAAAHNTDEVLDLIVNEATRLLGVSGVIIRLLEGDSLILRARTSGGEGYTPEPDYVVEQGTSLPGHVMATKKPLFGDDAVPLLSPRRRQWMNENGYDPAALGAVPLSANDQSIGTISVADYFHHGRRFTEDEIALLMAFADQASLALEKARLLNEAEQEKERSDALYRVSNLLAGAHDTDEVLNLIVNEAARLVGASGAIMRLLEGDTLVARAATETAADYYETTRDIVPLSEDKKTPVAHVMATKKPLFGDDLANMRHPELLRSFEERGRDPAAGAVVPLLANGQAIGVFSVADYTSNRRFTEDEVSLLSAFADQASLALEKARLMNEAEREKERSDALYQVSNRLAGAHDTDEVLDLIVNEAARLVGAAGAYIRLLEGDLLVPRAVTRSAADLVAGLEKSDVVMSVGEGIMGRAMATKEPITVEDMEDEMAHPQGRLVAKELGFLGAAAVPLIANDRYMGCWPWLTTASAASPRMKSLS